MLERYYGSNKYATREFDVSKSNGPFDDGALRSPVLEFAAELISRSLILEQCPAADDLSGWPDVTLSDPFANMGSAACKRYVFLTQHSLPRTSKGYLGVPVLIRACIDNCYFRAATLLLGSRAPWYYLGQMYYRRTFRLQEELGDGRHLERITCIYMRWYERMPLYFKIMSSP